MRIIRDVQAPEVVAGGPAAYFATWSIRKKLLSVLLPSVAALMFIAGSATNWASITYLNIAIGRTVILQTLAQAHALESLLEQARLDLQSLAKAPITADDFQEFMEIRAALREDIYQELAFIGQSPNESLSYLRLDGKVSAVSVRDAAQMRNGPLLVQPRYKDLKSGQTAISEVMEVFYPQLSGELVPQQNGLEVIRLITPSFSPEGTFRGYCLLSVNAQALRNTLSLYNSPKSPLHGFPRAPENRYSFFHDEKGWIVFQSENIEEGNKPLATDTARAGLTGDHGKPLLAGAFRPSPKHELYWKLVVETRQGRHGLESVDSMYEKSYSLSDFYFLGYSPVRFTSDPEKDPEIIGGVAYVDKSRLNFAAELRQIDVMFVITIGSILVMTILVLLLSRQITKPIRALAKSVARIGKGEGPRQIELLDTDSETTSLKNAINRFLDELDAQREEIEAMDEHLKHVLRRQRVTLEPDARDDTSTKPIIGKSASVAGVKALIRKTAAVDADVLVIGETGTGKELASEAIHQLSARSGGPFISINCGALDENLLLDALFGHVKGAFSEAKTDRKGAFLAADGGTLFLDEIGNASAKVQQALLRSLSVRKIRPLGSDEELDFNARVIAATNVDLKELSGKGAFREDLYYRLKVITIMLSPLRERSEDIPPLAAYFLKESALLMKKPEIGLSKGALQKLQEHDWPGNIRELKNCLTRTSALLDHDVIYAEDLSFDEDSLNAAVTPWRNSEPAWKPSPQQSEPAKPPVGAPARDGLNARQKKALEFIRKHGSIRRQEYKAVVGEDVHDRTAQYDLRDLVGRGLLRKDGKGPATKYYSA
jgi:two-component system, NtrC family, response regulator HydG